MAVDDVQEKLKALRKDAQEVHKDIMLACANYADLLDSVTKLGLLINTLYIRLDEILNGENKA